MSSLPCHFGLTDLINLRTRECPSSSVVHIVHYVVVVDLVVDSRPKCLPGYHEEHWNHPPIRKSQLPHEVRDVSIPKTGG